MILQLEILVILVIYHINKFAMEMYVVENITFKYMIVIHA